MFPMLEAAFLKKNASKWKEFEDLLSEKHRADPDKLAELFIQVTDDLSYARTFYPHSSINSYLNGLAASIHQAIYRNRKEELGRFRQFWKYELPMVIHSCFRELVLALVITLISIAVGVVSMAHQDGFVRVVLGDRYVNMTESNIKRGDPMAVYKKMHEADMFFGITLHNIQVSFNAFVGGFLLSVGTIYLLFFNGVMLGAFHTMFAQHGLLGRSLLTVYVHGALEIPAIIIAGCAGLVIGNSLLFPGTYSRAESFLRGAKKGLKICIGLVPIFIVAGFLESFVTRHTGDTVVVNLLIIFLSLGFIIWYFVLYPQKLARTLSHEFDTPAT